MKVLFNCHVPFMLAHGGAQIQIEQTKVALERVGLEVEPLRWWDPAQSGDVLHHFGRIPTNVLQLAQQKGMKVVMSPFMSGVGARPAWARFLHRMILKAVRPIAPEAIRLTFGWGSYLLADACIAMTPFEASLMTKIFNTPPERVHVVPNGVEEVFLKSDSESGAERGKWLVCTAAIIELKQVLKLAEMAVKAQTPIWFIGKAYTKADHYTKRFEDFARQHREIIRYEGPIAERARLAGIYRQARGFVLLSRWESLSLSALEAAACKCPLLLSDLPWAREAFKEKASYCPHDGSVHSSARILQSFYDAAPNLEPPPQPMSWSDVARQLKTVYESLLTTSR